MYDLDLFAPGALDLLEAASIEAADNYHPLIGLEHVVVATFRADPNRLNRAFFVGFQPSQEKLRETLYKQIVPVGPTDIGTPGLTRELADLMEQLSIQAEEQEAFVDDVAFLSTILRQNHDLLIAVHESFGNPWVTIGLLANALDNADREGVVEYEQEVTLEFSDADPETKKLIKLRAQAEVLEAQLDVIDAKAEVLIRKALVRTKQYPLP